MLIAPAAGLSVSRKSSFPPAGGVFIPSSAVEVLLPVVSTLLALSPEEVERVRKAYQEGVHRQGSDPMDYATKAATDVTSYLSGWVFSSKK